MGTSTLLRALTPRLTEFIPHTPSPRQTAFLLLPHREALFGGAAGGGKTDALLMAALQYVDVPGYAALLLRRTFRQLALEESLLDRAAEWLSPTPARWNGKDMRWTFPSGATLTFGYLDRDADKYQYQSAAYQFIGWDELTQWPSDSAYRYMFSRLRRLDTAVMRSVPLRVRAGTNPGGLGHEWVRRRFGLGTPPLGETWHVPPSRVFVRSLMTDNPYLDQDAYRHALAELPEVERRQLEHGDWDVRREGKMLKRGWFNLVESYPTTDMTWCRFWDLAASVPTDEYPDPDWTAGVLMGLHRPTGTYWVVDVVHVRATAAQADTIMRQTAVTDRQRFGQVRVRWEREPGAAAKKVAEHLRRHVFAGFDARDVAPRGAKEERARPFASALEPRGDARGLVSVMVADWTDGYLSELEMFPSPGVHDDMVDATTGAFSELALPSGGYLTS